MNPTERKKFYDWLKGITDLNVLDAHLKSGTVDEKPLDEEQISAINDRKKAIVYGIPGSELPFWIQISGDPRLLTQYMEENGGSMKKEDADFLSGRLDLMKRLDKSSSMIMHSSNEARAVSKRPTLVELRDAVRLDGIDLSAVQSSTNGSWANVYELFLKSRGVNDITQTDLRAFRPAMTREQAESADPVKAAELSSDALVSPYDMGDLAQRALPNTVMREIRIDPAKSSPEAVTKLLDAQIHDILSIDRCPAGLMIDGRYHAIVGIADGKVEFSDFLTEPETDPVAQQPSQPEAMSSSQQGSWFGNPEVRISKNPHVEKKPVRGSVIPLSELVKKGMSGSSISLCWMSELHISKKDPHVILGIPDQSVKLDDGGHLVFDSEEAKANSTRFLDQKSLGGIESCRSLSGGVTGIDRAYIPKTVDMQYLRFEAQWRTQRDDRDLTARDRRMGYDKKPVYDASLSVPALPEGSKVPVTPKSGKQATGQQAPAPAELPVTYENLTVSSPAMFGMLFGLPGDCRDPERGIITQKELQDKKTELDPSQQEMFNRLSALAGSKETSQGMFENGMRGLETMAVLHYMHGHPQATFSDVMNPAVDPAGKHKAALDVISALERQAGFEWLPDPDAPEAGKKLAITKRDDTAMLPLVEEGMKTLSELNVRDVITSYCGRKDHPSPGIMKGIISDPDNREKYRNVLAALSDLSLNGAEVLEKHNPALYKAAADRMSDRERNTWEHFQRNKAALESERFLQQVQSGTLDHQFTPATGTISANLIMADVIRDRIADTDGRLADLTEDFQEALGNVMRSSNGVQNNIFKGKDREEVWESQELKELLAKGVPEERKQALSSFAQFRERIPFSRVSGVREKLANARTPDQMNAILEAMMEASPKGFMQEERIRDAVSGNRREENTEKAVFVMKSTDHIETRASEGDYAKSMIREGTVLKPERLALMKQMAEDYCYMIEKSTESDMSGFAERFERAYSAQIQKKPEAFEKQEKMVGAIEGITTERVQEFEDLYSRMEAEQSIWHKDSKEYKGMYEAVRAIHDRAVKGYDPKNPAHQTEMAGLFADAYSKAQDYSRKEVGGRTKHTQRGLDRKNFAVSIIANCVQHNPGDISWYLPFDMDMRKNTSEDPIWPEHEELDDLLASEIADTAAFRKNTITKDPVTKAVTADQSAKKPAASSKASDSSAMGRLAQSEERLLGTLQQSLDKRTDDFRTPVEKHLDKARLDGLRQGGKEAKELQEATGLRLDFTRTSGQSAFYAWLMAKKDYSLDQVLAMKDSNGAEVRANFDEFVNDMKTNYPNDPEGAKRLGELHRKAYDKLLEYRYPDTDIHSASDALKAQETAAFINTILVDLTQDSDEVISGKKNPENHAAYMEGAGGEIAMGNVMRKISASTSMCSRIFELGNQPTAVEYAERHSMFKAYWDAHLRGRSLAECGGPIDSEYMRAIQAHKTHKTVTEAVKPKEMPDPLSDAPASGNETDISDDAVTYEDVREIHYDAFDRKVINEYTEFTDRKREDIPLDQQSAYTRASIEVLNAREYDLLPWAPKMNQGIDEGMKESRLLLNLEETRKTASLTERPLAAMKDDLAEFAAIEGEPDEKMRRKASVMYTRIFGDMYDQRTVDRLSTIGKDPFDLITIDGRSVKSIIDTPQNSSLTELDKEQRMKAAVMAALGDPSKKVEFSTLHVNAKGEFTVSEEKHQLSATKSEIMLHQGIYKDDDLKEAAKAFMTGHPEMGPASRAENALMSSTKDLIKIVSDPAQDKALEAAGKDIYDCLFINGRSVNEIYAQKYASDDISGSRAESIKQALFAAARMDEKNSCIYRPVKENASGFTLLEGISVGIGADVKGISSQARERITADAERSVRIGEAISEHPALADLIDERASYGKEDLEGMEAAVRTAAGKDFVTEKEKALIKDINDLMGEINAGIGKREKISLIDPDTREVREDKEVLSAEETAKYHEAMGKFTELISSLKKPPVREGAEALAADMCRSLEENNFMYKNRLYQLTQQMTPEKVQTLDELYHRLKAEGHHWNSDEYKKMFGALEKIHEAAATFDPSDKKSLEKMAKLYTEAFRAADAYAKKEAYKTKKTDLGVERKNAALIIMNTVTKLQEPDLSGAAAGTPKADLTMVGKKGAKKKATSLSDLIAEELKATHAAFGEKAKHERRTRQKAAQAESKSRQSQSHS